MRLTSSTSKYRDLSSCVLLIAAICVLEAKTPDHLSFGTLYFYPVAWATWVGGLRWGLVAAAAATTAWGIANWASSPVYNMVGFRFWTMGNDLITYCFMAWLTDRFRRALVEQQAISKALREAKEEVETLEGLFPICAWCKRIRDDRGYWGQIEDYLARHKGAHVSHGICPDCRDKAREEFSGRSSVP